MKKLLQSAIAALALAFTVAYPATFSLFRPATGVLVGNSNTYVTNPAGAIDIIGLWSGVCTGSNFLLGDGSCGVPSVVTFSTVHVSSSLDVPSLAVSAGASLPAATQIALKNVCLADGTNCPGGGGVPGGANTQLQYNNAGAFGGIAPITWDAPNASLRYDTNASNGLMLGNSTASVGNKNWGAAITATGVYELRLFDDTPASSNIFLKFIRSGITAAGGEFGTSGAAGGSDWSVFGTLRVRGANFALSSHVTPSILNANANDYDPGNGINVRLSSSVAVDITGLVPNIDGRVLMLSNIGSFNITLKNDSGSSSANNRMLLGQDIVLTPNDTIGLVWNNTDTKWRPINHTSTLGTGLQSTTLAAGATNNLAVTSSVGFLDLDASSGASNVTGITAGYDGQIIVVTSRNAANAVTLNRLNAGSSAANRIRLSADLTLLQDQGVSLRYSSALALWIPMS